MKHLTIGITSYNRYLYLRALMESMRELDRRLIQFIVVDNGSTEVFIHPYLLELYNKKMIHVLHLTQPKDRNWVNDEYIAKNFIIEHAESDVILFLQDDLQFISTQHLLLSTAESFEAFKIPCCELNAVRASTIAANYDTRYNRVQGATHNRSFWIPKNNHFHTMGLFRKDVFQKYGKYPVEWPQTQEFWGHSEDWYDALLKQQMPGKQLNVSSWVPHFAPVWNDPRGGYAFIRGDKRYGHYLPPPSGDEYYQHYNEGTFLKLQAQKMPCNFSEVAMPIDWQYHVDARGDQIKFPQSQAMIDGPWEQL